MRTNRGKYGKKLKEKITKLTYLDVYILLFYASFDFYQNQYERFYYFLNICERKISTWTQLYVIEYIDKLIECIPENFDELSSINNSFMGVLARIGDINGKKYSFNMIKEAIINKYTEDPELKDMKELLLEDNNIFNQKILEML